MNDEEKKAIEILKDREYDFDELYCTFRQSFIKPYDKSIGIILELIEKQQKEIEELKAKNKILEAISLSFNEIQDRDKHWKDKIKAKIEVLEKLQKEFPNNDEIRIKIIAYKELLEKEE